MNHQLSLVDWRTRVADLYARVRATPDPAEGHRLWVNGRTELFVRHPESPVAARSDLELTHWPYDPSLRFDLRIDPATPEERGAPAGSDGTVDLRRIGTVALPIGGTLDVWWLAQYGGGVFVPVKDGTSGESSYGGGRYLLDTAKGAWLGGTAESLVLDLNFAYHPSCRYDDQWQCPLAPPGNTITARVEAGEQL
ncbi:DUF1684 domain-containing protein [Aeromicrobium sp. CF3.5]|uniref:DUF1684 domain-containing protein n=1 Tax=Aeromicrobium sp. CF3.5 TaxID=3373078 RepID=UPI003EE809D1